MQQQISSAHFSELAKYCEENPLENGWIQNGMLMQMIAGMFTPKGRPSPKLEQFLPRKRTKPLSIEEQIQKVIGTTLNDHGRDSTNQV